ncbi:MAG: FMN-binding protein [Ilumatobacteraceae bacterium]|nr:FMN-binding protein [Ilumatobacteraceae bacterium]
MTTAASGLVALLDRPSSSTADDVGVDAAALPDQGAVLIASEPPVVSSTLPVVVEQTSPASIPPVTGPVQQPVATEAPVVAEAPVSVETTTAVASAACDGQVFDGPKVSTIWGPVQVEAMVSTSGQICDIVVLRSPDDRRKSREINHDALPILHTRVIKAQSASIRGVSGATVTSNAYVRSLQAILDGVAGITIETIEANEG